MAPLIHDPAVRHSIELRLARLAADTPRRWGKMTVDQMLWHVNEAMEGVLGRRDIRKQIPIPGPILAWMVVYLPWGKGAPTHPSFVTGERHDFAAERARTLRLIDEICAKPVGATDWGKSPSGSVGGKRHSQTTAKHLHHHLTQFGL